MKRWGFFIYGIVCHVLFLATFSYMACFVGNLVVPMTIDGPTVTENVVVSCVINLLLVAMFALQHSVMARPTFKRYWTRLVPRPIERSTYVLASCIVTAIWMWQWRPIDTIVWNVEQPVMRGILWTLFGAGWLLVPAISLMINHFDLFGTRQVWLHFRGQEYEPLAFRTPLLYAHVRHPLYLGWAMVFWATPTMTFGHLIFAISTTLYMMAAAVIEERDLIDHYGSEYRDYRRNVPMFIPLLKRPGGRVDQQPVSEAAEVV